VALTEAGVGPGDEVIVPTLTFIASANPVCYLGAAPVFVDVDPVTYTADPARVAEAISPATRAIVVVHLYGHPVDMDPILALAGDRGIMVIEDATEALGSRYRGRLCGTLGDLGCFSFNGSKVMTAGGGGMVLVSDSERLEHVRHLTLQARQRGREYVHDEIGFNYALSNLQAAVGLAQLEQLPELLRRRREVASRYASAFAELEGAVFSPEADWASSNFWLQSVLLDPADRDTVLDALDAAGVESRPFFFPLHRLPPYRGERQPDLPVADDLHARGVSLPSSADLTARDQQYIVDLLRAAILT